MYDIQKGGSKKVSEFFINSGVTDQSLVEQITTIGMDEQEDMLVISTQNNQMGRGSNQLARIMVMKLDQKGQLVPVCQNRFVNEKANSMYFYINFEYTVKGTPLIYAFQNEDQMRMDIFALRNNNLSLIYSHANYHSTDYSAIRSINGKFVSIDYDGMMRVLEVPE